MIRPGHAIGFLVCCCMALASSLPSTDTRSIDEARAAYAAGRFAEAAGIAEALQSAEGYALAAESLIIHAQYIAADGEREILLERAIGLAEKAVDSDPGNAGAYLQLARAMGRHAQLIGAIKASGRGHAKRIREATEIALGLEPEMAAAHLSLGLWNAEVVATVGPLMARLVYGARKKNALAAFERALKLALQAKAVPLEYAVQSEDGVGACLPPIRRNTLAAVALGRKRSPAAVKLVPDRACRPGPGWSLHRGIHGDVQRGPLDQTPMSS